MKLFSPMVKANTVRTILCLVVSNKWWLQQVDVNNAFLNGGLTEEIYMKQPPGFKFIDEKVIYWLAKSRRHSTALNKLLELDIEAP